jgi:hypothetical protein
VKELKMELGQQGRMIADWYQRCWPEEVWISNHVNMAIKHWADQRNKVCHQVDFFTALYHKAVADRSKYICDFLDDYTHGCQPRLDRNAPISAFDELVLKYGNVETY